VVENDRIQVRVKNGMYIREVGSDIEKGQVVVEKNARIGPAEVGILAMLGISEVKVFRKIIVGVLSTGSELCKLESKSGALPQPSGGKIFDSNSVMLKCALEEFGVEVLEFGIIGDNAEFLEQKMEEIIPLVDILVTSGGVSMGIADLVKPYLEKKGKIVFGRLLMKPGKPATFAVVEDCNQKRKKMVFALPGNPVSCLVCLHLLVRPAIHILQGLEEFNLPRIKVVLGQEIKMDPERPEFVHFCFSFC
jgi:gephyrin